jgi:hypothetical protein
MFGSVRAVRPEVATVLELLAVLMTPVALDQFGNFTCWIHTPIGQQLVVDTVAPAAREFWLPIILRSAGIWTSERAIALKTKPPTVH